MKILLTDVHLRKSFDIYNIYRRYYSKESIILCSSKRNFFLSLAYFKKINYLSSKKNDFNFSLNKIINLYENETIIYFPIEEETTILFYDYILKNKKSNLKYLLPNYTSFNISRNKLKLNDFCNKIDIQVPKVFNNLKKILNKPQKYLPIIVKPKIGMGSKNIFHVNNKKSLIKISNLNLDYFFIQEKINNSINVIGSFYLMKNGKLISNYIHNRIRTFPKKGGASVYSKTMFNNKIKNLGKIVLEKLNWNGIAMVEFLYCSKTDNFKLIEINPRAWGSILLSEFSGQKFLKNYINVINNNELNFENKEFKDKKDIFYIKWLFPFEFLNFLFLKSSFKEFFLKTCYINITYSNIFCSFFFHLYQIFNLNILRKFLRKN